MQPNETGYTGKERRQFPRESIVVVEYALPGTDAKLLCFPRNISLGGVSIIVNEEIALNTVLNLFIYVPNKDAPVEIKGKVRWINDTFTLPHKKHWILGIEFIEVDDATRKKLEEAFIPQES